MSKSFVQAVSLPSLVIHAGAGSLPKSPEAAANARESLRRIIRSGYERLRTSSALDCVVWVVAQLEDDPQFNAGTGAKLQSDGVSRLTGALMDGNRGRFSGVVNVETVRNPVLLAQKLQMEEDRVLVAAGAEAYARSKKIEAHDPITPEALAEWKNYSKNRSEIPPHRDGTVGAVAVDRNGDLAAATSTGGKGMEIAGRMSDVATVAGTFASRKAAVSATGTGEDIVDAALAVRIVTRVDDGMELTEAFGRTFAELRQANGHAGAIGVDVSGRVYVDTTTPCILHAIYTSEGERGYP